MHDRTMIFLNSRNRYNKSKKRRENICDKKYVPMVLSFFLAAFANKDGIDICNSYGTYFILYVTQPAAMDSN